MLNTADLLNTKYFNQSLTVWKEFTAEKFTFVVTDVVVVVAINQNINIMVNIRLNTVFILPFLINNVVWLNLLLIFNTKFTN